MASIWLKWLLVLDGEANRGYFLRFDPTPEEVRFAVRAVIIYLVNDGGSILFDRVAIDQSCCSSDVGGISAICM